MHDDPPSPSAREAFAALADRLFKQQDRSFTELADAIGSNRYAVSAAIRGQQNANPKLLPVRHVVRDLDNELGADGQLIRAWQAAKLEAAARDAGLDLPRGGLLPILERTVITEEVSTTDRRALLRLGAATPAIAAALSLAERASLAMSTTPAEWTLTRLEEGTTTIAETYWSTPQDKLLGALLSCWEQSEEIAQATRQPETQARVAGIAGQYAYYLARLGYHTGDRELAAGFATVAEQYAAHAGDSLLAGSVAGLRSCIAFNAGRYTQAARFAQNAIRQPEVDPYVLPRLAAYAAVAEGAGNRPDRARQALEVMQEAPLAVKRRAGAALFDPEEKHLYTALTLAEINDPDAEPAAYDAIEIYKPYDTQSRSVTWCALALALRTTDPGRAAEAASQALTVSEAWPSAPVVTRASRVHVELTKDHPDLREVAALGQRLAEV